MISDICKIVNGTTDLAKILEESQKVAIYNDLTKKQSMQQGRFLLGRSRNGSKK